MNLEDLIRTVKVMYLESSFNIEHDMKKLKFEEDPKLKQIYEDYKKNHKPKIEKLRQEVKKVKNNKEKKEQIRKNIKKEITTFKNSLKSKIVPLSKEKLNDEIKQKLSTTSFSFSNPEKLKELVIIEEVMGILCAIREIASRPLMRILHTVKRLELKDNTLPVNFYFLKAQFYNIAAREPKMKDLVDILDVWFQKVKEPEDFKIFTQFIEGIVAFFNYYERKKEGS